MKALFLPSHVGLGHVARDEAIARSLRKSIPNLTIEWCSAEPALSHLKLWGEEILPCSRKLISFSRAVEGVFNKHGYKLKELKGYLKYIKRNYEVFVNNVILDNYDLIFADEFWEVMLSGSKEMKDKIVFGSDLVFMPYGKGLRSKLLSLVLNRYFRKSFLRFRQRIYMNTLAEAPKGRWYLVSGESVKEWISKNMFVAGLCTSYVTSELPSVKEARKKLGIHESERLIVTSIGGTSARGESMLQKVFKAVERLRNNYGFNARLAIVSGPRTELYFKGELPDWVNSYEVLRSLSTLYMAGDLFIVRPGRTTTADLECLPKNFRGILMPIKGHLEHEHIAKEVSTRFPNLFRVISEDIEIRELTSVIKSELNSRSIGFRSPPKDCRGIHIVSKYLSNSIKDVNHSN